GQTAGTVVTDRVGAGADGRKYGAAFGNVVRSAGDSSIAVGSKHSSLTIRDTTRAGVEIEAFNLVDILPAEAGVGEISSRNEPGHGPIIRPTAGADQKQNQAQHHSQSSH